jgi:hypothetical protein
MRDPARIDTILAALREAWLQAPDERLGQFLDNCFYLNNIDIAHDDWYHKYMFHFEDDKWLNAIKSRFSKE